MEAFGGELFFVVLQRNVAARLQRTLPRQFGVEQYDYQIDSEPAFLAYIEYDFRRQ